MDNSIGFPGVGLEFDPSRIFFSLGGRDFYWYGVILAVGFLLAALYAIKRAPRFGIKSNDFIDILIFATPIAIIFARLYYVAFEFDMYRSEPIRILFIWEGGIAVYGAIIGGVLTAIVVALVKKIKVMAVLDIGVLGLLIGQCIGRWGNFINREAYGTVTDLPWRMEIYNAAEGVRQAVHPTFLYESLWTGLGFIALHIYSRYRKVNGEIFLLYIAWYGVGRGIIEGLRTDSLYLFDTGLRVSQAMAFGSCILAIVAFIALKMISGGNTSDLTIPANSRLARKNSSGPTDDSKPDSDTGNDTIAYEPNNDTVTFNIEQTGETETKKSSEEKK